MFEKNHGAVLLFKSYPLEKNIRQIAVSCRKENRRGKIFGKVLVVWMDFIFIFCKYFFEFLDTPNCPKSEFEFFVFHILTPKQAFALGFCRLVFLFWLVKASRLLQALASCCFRCEVVYRSGLVFICVLSFASVFAEVVPDVFLPNNCRVFFKQFCRQVGIIGKLVQ